MPHFDPANPDFDGPIDPVDRERWRRLIAPRENANPPRADGASIDCLPEIELASWIDSRIADPAKRDLIESHLASCPVCMVAMLEVRRALESHGDARGENLVFVAPEVLAAAKALVSPAEIDLHVVRQLRSSRWMGIAQWSGAAAASVLIGVIGWQAGQATNVSGHAVVAGNVAADDDRELPVSELSLGALGGADDEDDFNLLALSFDEGSTS